MLTVAAACPLLLVLQVFMLPADRRLDESTLQEILVSGHSRIPLHEPGDRCAQLHLLG
jgi:metal transporter CNNM